MKDASEGTDPLLLHALYRGKVQIMPKCAIRSAGDWAAWYTPGVAAPCKSIAADPASVYEYTNRGNTIAIVSDGTRVLGLGDIGPEAGLPVMEGKALLFKYLGGVDAVPICLGVHQPEEIVAVVKALEPSFGAINLEDIAQPKCFRILDALRRDLTIPVWHDDQQGSATVVLAGLTNALMILGKDLGKVRIAMIGMGAANVATYRLLKSAGATPAAICICDSRGILHKARGDIEARQAEFADKWQACLETNGDAVIGGIQEALRGADVCIAFSRPGPAVIDPIWIKAMATNAIVFACANPVPEIWPQEAQAAGARIVATGRSDFPNQVNNCLAFPGLFRGVLDVRARQITDEMAMAAAHELAACAQASGLREDRILPTVEDWQVPARVAAAVARAAQAQGLAARSMTPEQVFQHACRIIDRVRTGTEALIKAAAIAPWPELVPS